MSEFSVVKVINNTVITYDVANATKQIDLGSLTYTHATVNGNHLFYATVSDISPSEGSNKVLPAWSDIYTAVRQGQTLANFNMSYRYPTSGSREIAFVNNSYTTAATFKTAMTGKSFTYVTNDITRTFDVAREV